MQKFERISLCLSIIAIAVSIGTPIVGYYWLDPSLKAFKLRARLQVSPLDEKWITWAISAGRNRTTEPMGPTNHDYQIEIFNAGQLPAKDIKIIVEPAVSSATDNAGAATASAAADKPTFTFDPPVESERKEEDKKTFIILKGSLAPKAKMTVTFSETPRAIWVENEFGETSELRPADFSFLKDLGKQATDQLTPEDVRGNRR